MIRINRGPEPPELVSLRESKLVELRALNRAPRSDEISGYRIVARALWTAQHYKCCYCEQKIFKSFNDVEHYRPKGAANRAPGCNLTHGYWWLAFTWCNLLYACPLCNRSNKNDRFPLKTGSVSLSAETMPPGNEVPLLLDPGANLNPIEHITFRLERVSANSPCHWWARPRDGSPAGSMSIEVCDLNHIEQLELRRDYFDNYVKPRIRALDLALDQGNVPAAHEAFSAALGLLEPRMQLVAFAYEALRQGVPDTKIVAVLNRSWPHPSVVA